MLHPQLYGMILKKKPPQKALLKKKVPMCKLASNFQGQKLDFLISR